MRPFALAVAVLICLTGEVRAQAVLYGWGTNLCQNYLNAAKKSDSGAASRIDKGDVTYFDELHLYVEWVHGFLTALNIAHPDNNIRIDEGSLGQWLNKWCSDHPTEFFSHAAEAFVRDQYRQQGVQ